jgi:hypothetical protein
MPVQLDPLTEDTEILSWEQLQKRSGTAEGVSVQLYISSMNQHIENQRRAIKRLEEDRKSFLQMFGSSILTLAKIDAALDVPDDGCAHPGRTLEAIRVLKEKVR